VGRHHVLVAAKNDLLAGSCAAAGLVIVFGGRPQKCTLLAGGMILGQLRRG